MKTVKFVQFNVKLCKRHRQQQFATFELSLCSRGGEHGVRVESCSCEKGDSVDLYLKRSHDVTCVIFRCFPLNTSVKSLLFQQFSDKLQLSLP